MKYGIRYHNRGGECIYRSALMTAEDVGRWWLYSPDGDGLSVGATRDEAIVIYEQTISETLDRDEIDPVASEVQGDSLLTGVVEIIHEDEE